VICFRGCKYVEKNKVVYAGGFGYRDYEKETAGQRRLIHQVHSSFLKPWRQMCRARQAVYQLVFVNKIKMTGTGIKRENIFS
jgi:hypothetical protein